MKRAKIEDEIVKAEDATAEETVEVGRETMLKFNAASHDRCSNRLAITEYKWVQRSHLIHI